MYTKVRKRKLETFPNAKLIELRVSVSFTILFGVLTKKLDAV